MNDEQFDELMRDAAQTYRRPAEPDLDAMWEGIDKRWSSAAVDGWTGGRVDSRRWVRRLIPAVGVAATLVIGIGIGRLTMRGSAAPAGRVAVQHVASVDANDVRSAPYQDETTAYLGQTAALLIALPAATHAGKADEQFVRRASDLLTRTRLLIDSPASSDPQIHELLEDLELVLAQIVRLQAYTTENTELDLINRALEQRDVIPRLQTAVADISAY
jgi:hypothetical protein